MQVTAQDNIISAANLIANIDPKLAELFLNQPFRRGSIIKAFHASLLNSSYAHLADSIKNHLEKAVQYQNDQSN